MTRMKRTTTIAAVALGVLALGAAAGTRNDDEEQEARMEAFSELLTGARLTGWFTDTNRPDSPPMKDSYVISRCEHSEGDTWLFEALVGETDLKVPLYLTVKWAGDTPVITLDQLPIPQMGTFDARVLFHGNSYAGVWSGASHAGEMGGRITRAEDEDD
jgi:hypothetical protein